MKKRLLGLTVAIVMALSLNVAVFGGGSGGCPPPDPWSAPICLDCECCPEYYYDLP